MSFVMGASDTAARSRPDAPDRRAASYIEPGLFDGAAAVRDWPFGSLAPMAYDLIMADPPWRFGLRSEEG